MKEIDFLRTQVCISSNSPAWLMSIQLFFSELTALLEKTFYKLQELKFFLTPVKVRIASLFKFIFMKARDAGLFGIKNNIGGMRPLLQTHHVSVLINKILFKMGLIKKFCYLVVEKNFKKCFQDYVLVQGNALVRAKALI